MHITILGRQPSLGIAELESLYGQSVRWFSGTSALVDTNNLSVDTLGGSLKAAQVVSEFSGDWRQASQKIVSEYSRTWINFEGKITLGISAYGFDTSARDVQKTGIILKQKLKKNGVSLRLIPNSEPALSTATSHHNKLGLSPNKVELLVVRNKNGRVIISESTGAQNITALAKRDQNRPKRDPFVGMLPPKLAQIMINLASDIGENGKPNRDRILDPFCGTGVILQEAALKGHAVYGTDLADKMIDYTRANLEWLAETHHLNLQANTHQADARTATWQQPIGAVVCESYLGQPLSAPPSPAKLSEVQRNCNHIISEFLQNIASQITPGTPLCVAVPAWRDSAGNFTHLTLLNSIEKLGFQQKTFTTVQNKDLIYFRPDQVVARELLVLIKS